MLPYQNLSLEDMPGEVWRSVPNYNGLYSASTMGRIKRSATTMSNRKFPEKILTQSTTSAGYLVVSLSLRKFLVSRTVLATFVPNVDGKPTVDHINANPLDNRLCNLRWATYAENANNPISKARLIKWAKGGGVLRGKEHYRSIPIAGVNLSSKTVTMFDSITDASKVGGSGAAVVRCAKKVTASTHGWRFFYINDPELKAHLPKQSESQEP